MTMFSTGSGAVAPGAVEAAAVKMATRASARRCRSVLASNALVTRFAVGGCGGVPVGVELGADEPVEDLPQHRPLGGPEVGAEMDFGADGGDGGVAVVMGPFMITMGPVSVGQCLPPGEHDGEVGELKPHRMIDQQRFGVGELGGAAPVGVDLGDHPHLIDADLTGA